MKQRFDENEEIISNWFMGNKFAKPWRFISHYPVHCFRQSPPYVTREREREREFLFERETEHLWLRQLMHGHEYLGCYALPLLRTNAHILRLPFEL